jgi:hypothetical protein
MLYHFNGICETLPKVYLLPRQNLQFTARNEWLSEARLLNRIEQTEMVLDSLEHQGKIVSADRINATLAQI